MNIKRPALIKHHENNKKSSLPSYYRTVRRDRVCRFSFVLRPATAALPHLPPLPAGFRRNWRLIRRRQLFDLFAEQAAEGSFKLHGRDAGLESERAEH